MHTTPGIHPPRLVAVNPPGAAYAGLSQAVIARADNLMFITGHVAIADDGEIVKGDFETQLDATFRNIGRTLRAAGTSFESVVRFTYYVVDYEPEMLSILRKVRSRYITGDVAPASTFVAVAALYDPELRVEIDGVAILPSNAGTSGSEA
jgi:enamine deaminase RidA (YjgF/YER057c/UK114 family)